MGKRRRKIKRNASVEGDGRVVEEVDADDGLLWVQEVVIRPKSQRTPMAQRFRWKKKLEDAAETFDPRNSLIKMGGKQPPSPPPPDHEDNTERATGTPKKRNIAEDNESISDADYFDDRRQFTVTSLKKEQNCAQRIFSVLKPNVEDFSYHPNALFVEYINWTFRTGFFFLFVSFLCFFMLLTFAFGGFLKLAGEAQPGCIVVSGETFGTNSETTLADAYALSWTTFTTVGYGMTYTATGVDHGPQEKCWLVVALCTTESFIGLLYAGMCAAILFGKIGRIQSHAQVFFSNAICITFGSGGTESGKRASLSSDDGHDIAQAEDGRKIPCPVLSIQVLNQQCNKIGGEIMDANLRMVAANNRADFTGNCVASYKKVQMTEFEHPFFNRVWQGRHILDASSPLLSPFAKAMIRQNGGYWPSDWNSAIDVRNALQFTDLIVTITGISNVSASTVHAYRKFKFGDVLVGYEFASVLYTNPGNHRIKVDPTLVNDVIEQHGGGAEAFGGEDDDDDEGSWGQRSVHMDPSTKAATISSQVRL